MMFRPFPWGLTFDECLNLCREQYKPLVPARKFA
jgi:hypothetical protein